MLDGDIIALRERVEELEETVRQLQDLLRSPREAVDPTWRLPPAQRRMLVLLAKRGSATGGQLAEAAKLFPNSERNPECVRVQMHRLRKNIARHGAAIVTVKGIGYALDEASRKIVQAAIFAVGGEEINEQH